MRLRNVFLFLGCYFLAVALVNAGPKPEEPAFELPVQLIGFPVIIAAVRITNFVKKLAYSLNPGTYANRVKREVPRLCDYELKDIRQIEKELVSQFGNNVCIYENLCAKYAKRAPKKRGLSRELDWFFEIKSSPNVTLEYYLLSMSMGNILRSPRLCHRLAKRGRGCDEATLSG